MDWKEEWRFLDQQFSGGFAAPMAEIEGLAKDALDYFAKLQNDIRDDEADLSQEAHYNLMMIYALLNQIQKGATVPRKLDGEYSNITPDPDGARWKDTGIPLSRLERLQFSLMQCPQCLRLLDPAEGLEMIDEVNDACCICAEELRQD